jgi:hypothetical protein
MTLKRITATLSHYLLLLEVQLPLETKARTKWQGPRMALEAPVCESVSDQQVGFLLGLGMSIGIEILFLGIFYSEHRKGLNKAANLLNVIKTGVKIGNGYHSYYAYLSTIKLSNSSQHGGVFLYIVTCSVTTHGVWIGNGIYWTLETRK